MPPKDRKPTTVPAHSLLRVGKLLATGSKLIGREIASRAVGVVHTLREDERLKKRLTQAKTLVDSLSQLKGAAMKAGQMLSLEFSDILPPEVTAVLRKLHDESSFMDIGQVEKILRLELGDEKYSELKDISQEPVAAASIGQVHNATLRGERVALKVQFPGVDRSIGMDLALVKKTAQSVLWVKNQKIELDDLFEELERVLKQEVDFTKEAGFLLEYEKLASPFKQYRVPKVYTEFSTRHLLTLSFEDGLRLKDWMLTSISEKERQGFTHLALDLVFKEFFEWGLVQTDPNYGNFLFRPEQMQLVLLDFGATNRYSQETRQQVRQLWELALSDDKPGFLDAVRSMGFLDERESESVKTQFFELVQAIVKMVRKENQPFHFSDPHYLQEIRERSLSFVQQVKYTAPAKELIFLNRKLAGIFHLLKDLGGSADLHAYWLKVRSS